jgi:glycerol-3-phosphate acyltransferase PlsX
MHVVVDLLGSDSSDLELFEGAKEASQVLGEKAKITVIGSEKLRGTWQQNAHLLHFLAAEEEVHMHESPLLVVRRKQNSSMAIGIKMLKNKECDAFVSAGNTGAMTVYASLELERLPGVSRPALLTELPTETGSACILDVGANVSFQPETFFQYALLGAAYQKVRRGVQAPKIGLLNIGVEVRKGTRTICSAHEYFCQKKQELDEANLYFEGNIESRDFFRGLIDVLVTDGFTGNIFLKTCEGVSAFIVDQLRKHISSKHEALEKIEKYVDYAQYPGAILIGVDGVVVKCHGCSSKTAMFNAILGAHTLAEDEILEKIKAHLLDYQTRF